jgi:hypothetical protein
MLLYICRSFFDKALYQCLLYRQGGGATFEHAGWSDERISVVHLQVYFDKVLYQSLL